MERIVIAMQRRRGGCAACGGASREANLILSCRRTSIIGPPVGGTFWFQIFIQAPSPEIWSETISGGEEVLAGKWGGLYRLMALTADLLRQPVAVIYAGDNITAVMVKSATTTIPVVFRIGGDPIQLGLVTSLSRPDGNMTGVSFLGTATGAIRLQMMREAVPNAAVMGLLVNPANPNAELDTQEAQN